MKRKSKSTRVETTAQSCRVCFDYVHPAAQSAAIAGSFNDWNPSATPMISRGDGKWRKELTLPPGRYEYRFVVDGEWTPDPSATESVPNPFGGVDSVLIVTT